MGTKIYRITVVAKQNLLLDQKLTENANLVKSGDFITGATFRGALANQWLKLDPDEQNELFKALFVEGNLSVSNLYPFQKSSDPFNDVVGPIPETAISCERFPGFSLDSKTHGVQDFLFRQKEIQNAYQNAKKSCHSEVCKSNDTPVTRFEGLFSYIPGQKESAHRTNPLRVLKTKSALNSYRGSGQGRQPFSMEILEKDTAFTGTLKLHRGLDLGNIEVEGALRIGSGKVRGMGRVQYQLTELKSPSPESTVGSRLDQMQEIAGAVGLPLEEKCYWVTLDLQSPLLFRDRRMGDRLEICEPDLKPYGPKVNWNLENASYFAHSVQVEGGNNPWQKPKEVRRALGRGGVILLQALGKRVDVVEALAKIEQFGLGEQLSEGFGEILTCHPFHHDFS